MQRNESANKGCVNENIELEFVLFLSLNFITNHAMTVPYKICQFIDNSQFSTENRINYLVIGRYSKNRHIRYFYLTCLYISLSIILIIFSYLLIIIWFIFLHPLNACDSLSIVSLGIIIFYPLLPPSIQEWFFYVSFQIFTVICDLPIPHFPKWGSLLHFPDTA